MNYSEEEKEAIAHLIDMSNLSLIGDGTVIIQNETITTVLNLIQKQENELDIIKCNYEILQGEMDRIGIDTLKLEPGNSTDDVIEEIRNKDKIIDKMAEQLAGLTIWNDNIQEPLILGDKEEVIEYYKKVVDEDVKD